MKKKPFFSKFLENQNENLEDVKGGKFPINPPKVTLKYPSDNDEGMTRAYPNDELEVM
jgi:hypothetical protein